MTHSGSVITAAYLHIPFCQRRCFYCDFPISVLGDRAEGSTSGSVREYVAILCQEVLTTVAVPGPPLQSVFFGGGTPSLLSPAQLGQILSTLDRALGIAAEAEISLEIDPGTFTLDKLRGFQSLGVNRFSLGVQAFQDELLAECGRAHRRADIDAAVEQLATLGITNWSLDLISGLPHQTLAQWETSLQSAIALQPAHISCYDLVLEAVTPFGKRYAPGVAPLPSDDLTAEMYRQAQARLTAAGYHHYEISNYARSGAQCRHNRVYWQNLPYYGFGMGATSYIDGQRFARPRKRSDYYPWVAAGCPIATEPLSERDRVLETLMLGLRLADGVDLAQFGSAIAAQIRTLMQRYEAQGWVKLNGQNLRFSDPEGFLFSNIVLTTLFEQIDVLC